MSKNSSVRILFESINLLYNFHYFIPNKGHNSPVTPSQIWLGWCQTKVKHITALFPSSIVPYSSQHESNDLSYKTRAQFVIEKVDNKFVCAPQNRYYPHSLARESFSSPVTFSNETKYDVKHALKVPANYNARI